MDGLLGKLKECGVGCFVGNQFAGAFAYADDLILLCPSVGALNEMVKICCSYADEFFIKFNAKKSQLIIFKSNFNQVFNIEIKVNGEVVKVFDRVIHLGHILHDNIFKTDISKCVGDFNRQCNMFLANFKYTTSKDSSDERRFS